jgi:tetrahydromethanopterin S-methyltransferase subunit B
MQYLFSLLRTVVRWLRRAFRELIPAGPQTRSIEAAIDRLDIVHDNLTRQPANIDAARAQLAQIARFISREALLDKGSEKTLDLLIGGSASPPQILQAIDQLQVSLQTELAFNKYSASNAMNSSSDDAAQPASEGARKVSKTAKGASSAKADRAAAEAATLWTVTEKLYRSWQFRLLWLVMLGAVGLAVGGTFVLGGQTFRLHQNIDKAESDLKASKKLVEDLTDKNITDLTAMRKDAEKKIGDLKNEAEDIKKDAVKRVVEQLNTDLAGKLDQIKKDDANFINSQLALLAPAREKIAEDIDKIKKTLPLLGDAAKLEQTIAAINTARDQANSARDSAAQSAKEAKETAQNEVVKMQSLSTPLNDRMAKLEKSIPDLTPLNDRVAKLEKSAPDLTPLNGRMAKLEKSVSDLTALNDRVAKLEKSVSEKPVPDLAPLNARVARLEKSISDLAPPKLPDLTPLNERIAKVEKSISDLGPPKVPDLTPLNERIAKVEKSISDLAPPDLTPLNDRMAKVEKLVSDLPLDGRLADLERSVSDLYRLLNERLDELRNLGPDLAPLNDRIAKLEKSVAYLGIPFEPNLTVDQWEKIQIALTRRGFSPGPADGNPGSNTKKAIKQFQLKSGAPATGHLTKPQIAELLDLQSPEDKPR